MATMKSVLGYTVAALSILIMVVGDVAYILWDELGISKPLIADSGLVRSPWYSGGEVAQTVDHGAYRTQVHRPVFDAFIGERREGFVQVAWAPPDALPAHIDEEIDADADGRVDFRIELDTATRQAYLTPHSPNVIELEGVYDLGETLAVRVALKNPRR